MKDFLDFVNTSEKEALSSLPGSSTELAEQIISARPFSSVEDLPRVKGLTPELLASWQAKFEETSEQTDVAKEENPAIGQPSIKESSSQKTGNRTLRIVVRILIAVLILAALGAAAYFGIPYFYEKVLNPLESNTSRVSELANTHKTDMDRLETEISALQDQISALELRVDDIESSIASHSASLATLEEMQAALQLNLDMHKNEVLSQVDKQLTLTRSLELLSRSRLYLSQSNYGLAETDITEGRALLYSLLTAVSADEIKGLKVVISRLDLALDNLPEYPVVAVYDVDIAWKLLVDGLPNVPAVAVTPVIMAPTPSVDALSTPQSTPTVEATPIPGE